MKIKSLVIAMSLGLAVSASAFADDSAGNAGAQAAGQVAIDKLNQVFNQYNSDMGGVNWTDVLSIHGGMYGDGHWGSTNEDTTGLNNDRLAVTNAYLALEATPNDWSTMNVVLNYANTSDNYMRAREANDDTVFVDQAYITFGDFTKRPTFVQFGKQYTPFGSYELFPVVAPMTQVLSESNNTELQVGYVGDKGVFGSVYTFQNDVSRDRANSEADTNYGVTVGSQRHNDRYDMDMGIGYLNDMMGVGIFAEYLSDNLGYYNNAVHGATGYFKYHTGPFGLNADYVTTTSEFDEDVVPYEIGSDDGAKPWATGVQGSYDFMSRGMNSQIVLGYQRSGQASALGLPENRYVVGYNVFPWKNTSVGLQATRDSNYSSSYETWDGSAGDGDDYYTYSLRLGVKF